MTVRIGDHEFRWVRYDERGDVLYLLVDRLSEEEDRETSTHGTPEGHAVTFDKTGRVIGMTIVNAKWLIERDGKVTITFPSSIETSAEELAPALAGGH